MKTLKLAWVVAAILCFVSSFSFAQDTERRGACRADYEKFCKDVRPGQGRIVQCLRQHESELSAACKSEMAEGREKSREFVKACKADAANLCQDIRPGGGRIAKCLKANEGQLSPDCAAFLKK